MNKKRERDSATIEQNENSQRQTVHQHDRASERLQYLIQTCIQNGLYGQVTIENPSDCFKQIEEEMHLAYNDIINTKYSLKNQT